MHTPSRRPVLPRARRLVPRLAALALLSALLYPRAASSAPDVVPVPDVVGQSRPDAVSSLTAEGFLVAVYEVAGDPPDTVAAQSPGPGTSLPRGASVILDVRKAVPDAQPAPRAVGLSPSEAAAAFGALYVLEFQPVAGAPAQRGTVVAQDPAAGALLPIRGTLTLRYVPDERMSAQVVVPDVLGTPSADAVQAVGAAGLFARVATASVAGAPAGVAIAQWPFPGTEVARYGSIDLIVTAPSTDAEPPPTGAPSALTPNVVGLSESSARAAIDAAGLAAETQWVDGDPANAFLVQGQDPVAGTPIAVETPVKMQVVRYVPPPAPPGPSANPQAAMPNLVGMTSWQAEDLLASLGLVASPLLVPEPSVPELRVFAQQMPPGTWLDQGTAVAYRVSKPAPPTVPVPVPDFVGRSESAALLLAATAGLSLDLQHVADATHPSHRVVSQNVAAYTLVPVGSTVRVHVAIHVGGPTFVNVPSLLGLSTSQANAALSAAGLSGAAVWVYAPGHPLFKVFSQTPAAGTVVPAGAGVSFRVSKPGAPGKIVPDVSGLTKAAAIAAVTSAGLSALPSEVIAPMHPLGHVVAQSPAAGTVVAAGSPVQFQIAKAVVSLVPDVGGKTKLQAEAILSGAGFAVVTQIVPALGKPPGRVWDQAPNAGVLAAPGSSVTIRVQPGIVLAAVPNLVGLTGVQANAALLAAGFAADGTTVLNPLKPPGRVFDQNPVGGSGAPAGSTVHFRIASLVAPPSIFVPDLTGKSKAQALLTLSSAGLVGAPTTVAAPTKPPGKVFDQFPAPGTSVVSGATVQFKVAAVSGLVAVPNVLGRTAAQADSDLATAGLGSDGAVAINLFKPAHKVWAQSPAAGTLVAPGTVVHWKRNP